VVSCLLLVIYGLLIHACPPVFTTTTGLYSNEFIYVFRLILCFCFFLYFLYLYSEINNLAFPSPEYYFILLITFMSLNGVLISSSFINLFIFIEFYSLGAYFLILNRKDEVRSAEASIKYFIFGSFSSSLLLIGIFFVYISSGSLNMNELLLLHGVGGIAEKGLFLGAFLILTSLLIKLGAGVFYFWLLDVYEGSSYPVLIFLNLFVKAVYVFIIFNLIFIFDFPIITIYCKSLLFLSIAVGALGALTQTKVKRFLIFTSIYNIAFFSVTFWSSGPHFTAVFIMFTAIYLVNSLALMIIISSIRD
jgi:NADH-quinone oxidoreductase subunit N